MARKAISKRIRFEVFKRDGFRCKYCGQNATSAVLEIDHVVPYSRGGTDDPANLITACSDCNGGKSNVSLGESKITAEMPTENMKEHAEQIRAYLSAQKEVTEARNEVLSYLADTWREYTGSDPIATFIKGLATTMQRHSMEEIVDAMLITANKFSDRGDQGWVEEKRVRYFYGVLKRKAEKREEAA